MKPPTAQDDAGVRAGVLNLYLADPRQLFNSMDPAPFHERELDPEAAAYIVDWAREAPKGQPLRLVLQVGGGAPTGENAVMLCNSIHDHFSRRARTTRRQLQQLFRLGRYSLVIALVFLALVIVVGESIASLISRASIVALIQDSLVIGGWVALWHPLNIFLYDWWPIRADAKLFELLSTIDVTTVDASSVGHRKAGGLAG